MKDQALRSAPWSLVTYGSTRAILLLNTVVLARLLRPSDFGVLALATLAVGAFGFLGELGLGSAFTARQDLDRRDHGTVLSLMLVAGGITAFVVAAVSPIAANVFGEPRLAPVLAVLATVLFLNGFTWFYEQVLVRELQFRGRFVASLAQALTNLVVAVTSALLGAGVWSLVAGQLAGMVVQGVVQLRVTPYQVRLAWDPATAREMLARGRSFMVLGGLTFLRQNLDFFAVARLLGSAPLGFYSMAYRLAELPSAAVAGPIATVTFPTFVRMRSRGEDVGGAFLVTLRYVALATAPMAVILSAAARPFTLAVFGEEWRPMTGTLGVLGLWALIRPIQLTCSWFLNATGRAGTSALLTTVSLAVLVPGTFVAATTSGIEAVAWVILGEGVLTLSLYMRTIAQEGVTLRGQATALGPVLVAAGAAWCATFALVPVGLRATPAIALATAVAAGATVFFAVVGIVTPTTISQGRALMARALGRGGVARSGTGPST